MGVLQIKEDSFARLLQCPNSVASFSQRSGDVPIHEIWPIVDYSRVTGNPESAPYRPELAPAHLPSWMMPAPSVSLT